MKNIIEAPGLDFQPRLVESGNGWAVIYGCQTTEYNNFPDALVSFNGACIHAAKCTGIYDDGDYDLLEGDE